MADQHVQARLVARNDTAKNWMAQNPVLLQGEMGVETDTGKFKFGDGSTPWGTLPYFSVKAMDMPLEPVEGMSAATVQEGIAENFQSVVDGKVLLETAVNDKGGTVSKAGSVATFAELRAGINTIKTTPPNGRKWTKVIYDEVYNNIWQMDLCAGNGLLVLSSREGSQKALYYSSDGIIWTKKSDFTASGIKKIAYADGLWVVSAGRELWYSHDGKIWTNSGFQTKEVAKSFYKANGIWVTTTEEGNGFGIIYSEDGVTWKQTNITEGGFSSVYEGNGRWVAASTQNGLLYSNDGKHWENSDITDGYFYAPHYADGLWVVGQNNYIPYYSTDGKVWRASFDVEAAGFHVIRYANGLWVAGTGSGLLYSEDGIHWIQSNITQIGRTSFTLLEYACGSWVAGNSSNSGSYSLFHSSDGRTWEEVFPSESSIYFIHFFEGTWYAGRSEGLFCSKAYD